MCERSPCFPIRHFVYVPRHRLDRQFHRDMARALYLDRGPTRYRRVPSDENDGEMEKREMSFGKEAVILILIIEAYFKLPCLSHRD